MDRNAKQHFRGKRYEKPNKCKPSLYVAMAAILTIKQLPDMALSVKTRTWLHM